MLRSIVRCTPSVDHDKCECLVKEFEVFLNNFDKRRDIEQLMWLNYQAKFKTEDS